MNKSLSKSVNKISRELLICVVSSLTLSACAFSRDTPAPVVNATTPNQGIPGGAPLAASASRASASRAPVAPARATDDADEASNSETKVNKIDDEPDTPPVHPGKKAALSKDSAAVGVSGATWGGISWLTPTTGSVIHPYSTAAKGVDVAGHEGQAILAAADGKVAYSGNGLKGYGNLIIIKHQGNFLTAYSHNKSNLVKEADMVKRGQKIAELGQTDSDKPILHFELRQNGKPLDPTALFSGVRN